MLDKESLLYMRSLYEQQPGPLEAYVSRAAEVTGTSETYVRIIWFGSQPSREEVVKPQMSSSLEQTLEGFDLPKNVVLTEELFSQAQDFANQYAVAKPYKLIALYLAHEGVTYESISRWFMDNERLPNASAFYLEDRVGQLQKDYQVGSVEELYESIVTSF